MYEKSTEKAKVFLKKVTKNLFLLGHGTCLGNGQGSEFERKLIGLLNKKR